MSPPCAAENNQIVLSGDTGTFGHSGDGAGSSDFLSVSFLYLTFVSSFKMDTTTEHSALLCPFAGRKKNILGQGLKIEKTNTIVTKVCFQVSNQ